MGLIAELLSWIGLGLGIPLGVAWLLVRVAVSHWERTDAVIVGGRLLRWLDRDGAIHERELEGWEAEELGDADHTTVVARGDRARLLDAPHPGRLLALLTIVFLGLGVAAVIWSLVLVLLDH
ncbi:MAG TPA: hypothetical protein VN200_09225 [Rhodoglobus sp.]|nr:hypothetical protein [Rhodoglobus sp.]